MTDATSHYETAAGYERYTVGMRPSPELRAFFDAESARCEQEQAAWDAMIARQRRNGAALLVLALGFAVAGLLVRIVALLII